MFSFSDKTLKIVEAIVSVHETGRAHGKYETVAILPDGPNGVRQVTYGAHQATDASNTLDKIIARYSELKPGNPLEAYLETLRLNTRASLQQLAADKVFIAHLHEAGADPLMIQAQVEVFRANYMQPALDICAKRGYIQPLSLAVIYDSLIHGAFKVVSGRVKELEGDEKMWIARYIVERRNWLKNHSKAILHGCVYRMDTFLNLIIGDDVKTSLKDLLDGAKTPTDRFCDLVIKGAVPRGAIAAAVETGNWVLELPIIAHGITIAENDLG